MNCLYRRSECSYTLDDDIESLFYTFVEILSDGVLVWNTGLSSEDLRAYKITSSYTNFEDQIEYTPIESRHLVRGFRDLLFEGAKRKPTDIDTVINFLRSNAVQSGKVE